MITAATDGAAKGNPGPAGWAWYIDEGHWGSGGWARATNNQAELTAVAELLAAVAPTESLQIICDSRYVIDALTKWRFGWAKNGWRTGAGSPVANKELMQQLHSALRGRQVEFVWVKGHAGHPLNEAADKRASASALAYQAGSVPLAGPDFSQSPIVAADLAA